MIRTASPFAAPPVRRVKLKPRRDPVTPELYAYLARRDGRCAMAKVRSDHRCDGPSQVDHVRASGGLGLRSPSTPANTIRVCAWAHRLKTEWGKTWRPIFLDYIASVEEPR